MEENHTNENDESEAAKNGWEGDDEEEDDDKRW